VIFVTRRKTNLKKYERKGAFKLEGGGGLEGLQTTVGLEGRVGGIYSTRDI
jgi:hypothetical protein